MSNDNGTEPTNRIPQDDSASAPPEKKHDVGDVINISDRQRTALLALSNEVSSLHQALGRLEETYASAKAKTLAQLAETKEKLNTKTKSVAEAVEVDITDQDQSWQVNLQKGTLTRTR